jgi:hypothetical protein
LILSSLQSLLSDMNIVVIFSSVFISSVYILSLYFHFLSFYLCWGWNPGPMHAGKVCALTLSYTRSPNFNLHVNRRQIEFNLRKGIDIETKFSPSNLKQLKGQTQHNSGF